MRSHPTISGKAWNTSRPNATPADTVLEAWHNLLLGLAGGFRRARQRRDLAALSDHHLRDIGLSRFEVEREAMKPFWRP